MARDQVLRLSSYLREKGVGKGDRVMLVSENGPEWAIAAMAVLNLRAVLVPVAAIASNLEIENTFRGARPKFCIYSREIGGARHLESLLKTDGVGSIAWILQSESPLREWIERQRPADLDTAADESEVALLIYTSGTTGTPKGVPITHEIGRAHV